MRVSWHHFLKVQGFPLEITGYLWTRCAFIAQLVQFKHLFFFWQVLLREIPGTEARNLKTTYVHLTDIRPVV